MTAIVLSVGVVVLVIAALIAMGALDALPGGLGERLVAVRFRGENPQKPEKQAQAGKSRKSAAVTAHQVAVHVPRPVPTPPPLSKVPADKMIEMSRSEFAASDISNLGKSSGDAAGGGARGGGGSTYGPGAGPGGARLFKAEWYREPSHAEVAGYLGKGAPPGSWGMIACRTIDHYHVENCMQLGESPPGSGIARALRLAAWQFLVRPPRIDGKPQIGAWVSIRFDFSRPPEAGPEPRPETE